MHGFSDRTGLDLADDDPEFAVGIRGDLVIPLVFNLERRILEHRYQLLIEGFDDLILFFNRRIRIADHHHGEVLIVLLYDAVRDDIDVYKIPATQMANEMGLPKLANVIIVGKLVKETGMFTHEELEKAVKKLVPASKPELFESNMKAFEAGYNY